MSHASVETYDLQASFPASVQLSRDGLMSDAGVGVVHHRQRLSSTMPSGIAGIRRWSLEHAGSNVTDYHRLVELWEASYGGCEPLTMTIRGFDLAGGTDETVQVRMTAAPLLASSVGVNQYTFTVELEEFPHAP